MTEGKPKEEPKQEIKKEEIKQEEKKEEPKEEIKEEPKEAKMVNSIAPAYSPENAYKVLCHVMQKHTNLTFIEAIEADHALNSLALHFELGKKA